MSIEIIKKKEVEPINTNIQFTATEKQRKAIEKIKAARTDWDVNAIFRSFTDKLIAESGVDLNHAG